MHRKGFDAQPDPFPDAANPPSRSRCQSDQSQRTQESAIADVFLFRLFAFVPTSRATGLYQRRPNCHAVKQSFGVPPHRYHNIRRIEHAKSLLMKPACSVTEIGLNVGFSETS
jgi:methylphosphotriester-DNA--protein-cysteine methyltransferase